MMITLIIIVILIKNKSEEHFLDNAAGLSDERYWYKAIN